MAEDSGSGGSGSGKIKFSDEAAQNLQNKVEQLRSALVSNPDLTDIRDKIPQVLPGSSPNAQQLRDKIKQFLDSASQSLSDMTDTKLEHIKVGIGTVAKRFRDTDQDNADIAGSIGRDLGLSG